MKISLWFLNRQKSSRVHEEVALKADVTGYSAFNSVNECKGERPSWPNMKMRGRRVWREKREEGREGKEKGDEGGEEARESKEGEEVGEEKNKKKRKEKGAFHIENKFHTQKVLSYLPVSDF